MAQSRVILITGASSGFGQQAAALLGQRGHRVFGTSRRPLPDAAGVRMLQLDVRDDQAVEACVQAVLAEAGRIDVLVNNAGYVLSSLIEEATVRQVQEQFDTNFLGYVRMTKAVLPVLRRQRGGTIINIGSLAGLLAVPGEGFYSATKFVIEGYSETLRYEVERFGIRVCIVEPSYFRTGIADAKVFGADRIDDYNGMRERIMGAFDEDARRGDDPRLVADLLARIVETPRPRLRYRVGRDARLLAPLRALAPDRVIAWGTRKWFGLDR